MSFSAINTVEQEIKQRNERHTLELQLEQAMGVYQDALDAQRLNQFELADEAYRRLFAFDVLQPRKYSSKADGDNSANDSHKNTKLSTKSLQLGPATRLRAMALKNYALLLLTHENVTIETTDEASGYLAEALFLVGSDDREKLVLPSLARVAWALGKKRLARLALETLAENAEGSALQPLQIWVTDKEAANRLLGPNSIESLTALDYIKACNEGGSATEKAPRMFDSFDNLVRIRESEPPLEELLTSESAAEISLTNKSWQSLLSALNDTLNSACKRSKRKSHKDTYNWAQKDLWSITFIGATDTAPDEAPLLQEDHTQDHDQEQDPRIVKEQGQELENEHEHGRDHEYEYQNKHRQDQDRVQQQDPGGDDANEKDPEQKSRPTASVETNDQPIEEENVHTPTEEQGNDQTESIEPDGTRESTPANPATSTPDGSPRVVNPIARSHSEVPFTASPAKRRRTERVKRNDLVLPADFGLLDVNFAQQFNAYVTLASQEVQFYSPAFLFLAQNTEASPELRGAAELRDILSRWDQKESNQFLGGATSMRNKKGGSAIMWSQQKNSSSKDSEEDEEDEDPYAVEEAKIAEALEVDNFLMNHNGMHIQQIRWSLAVSLLSKLSEGGQNPTFGTMVYGFINEIDSLLWSRKEFLSSDNLTTLFALYTDNWIRKKDSDTELKLRRWQSLSAIQSGAAHLWISAFADQENSESTPDSSVTHFESLLPLVIANGGEPNRFSFLQEIPALTVENAQVQISKFKAAAAFERVLTPPNTGRNGNSEAERNRNEEDIRLLQAMLMPESHSKPESTSDAEFEAIQNFLVYAPAQFKMGLWYTLLEKYEASGSAPNSLLGLTKIFTEAMTSLSNGEALLQTLSVSHDVGKRLVPLLERSPKLLDTIDDKTAKELLTHAIKLLQILQLFIVYDDAVNSNLMQKPVTPSWSKVLPKFRELVVMWWCIFYRLWTRCVAKSVPNSPETYNDILSIIHERLGNLGYCCAADGCLLTLHCSEIARMNWEGSAMDLSQCLKCKFGLTLSLYGDVSNHHTVPKPLNSTEAKELLPLVARLIFNHRSFNQLVMRMDTRAVIDEFARAYEVSDDRKLKNRLEKVQSYFTKDFTIDILKKSRMGLSDNTLSFPNSDSAHGVWVLQGIVLINQYRMRRRQAYGATSIRIESLEVAIDLFQRDIAAHPGRFESWVSLTQIWQYMCEDCLTFGDELSIPNTPAVYCQRALLAASMAIAIKISQYARNGLDNKYLVTMDTHDVEHALQPELADSLSSVIIPLYGYLLYLAVMPPLSKKPFGTFSRPVRPFLVTTPDVKYHKIALMLPREIHEKQALKVSLMCLDKSADAHQDWARALYQTNIAIKLDLNSERVIRYAKKAKEVCPSNCYDADYMLVYAIWHLLRQSKIDATHAIEELNILNLLNDTQTLNDDNERSEEKAHFLIEENLRCLTEKDKWMHRSRYLLAKIYETDHRDSKRAQQELMELFTLKSPTKPLVLWKRDSDIPGQHSVYIAEYVKYMTDLMYSNEDSAGLLLMAKRFRKAGWEMWEHTATFEHIYICASNLVRKLVPNAADTKYSDTLMAQVLSEGSEKFELVCKAMSEPTSGISDDDEWVQVLMYATELRKNHSGPATISIADDIVIIIFLNIFFQFAKAHPEVTPPKADTPNSFNDVSAKAVTSKASTPKASTPKASTPRTGTSKDGTPQPSEGKNPDNPSKKVEGSSEKPAKGGRKKASDSSQSRKKIIRKDVISAAQHFLKPFQQKITKIEEAGLPKKLSNCI